MNKTLIYGLFETLRVLVASQYSEVKIFIKIEFLTINKLKNATNIFSKHIFSIKN
jgi:hypothetical protein